MCFYQQGLLVFIYMLIDNLSSMFSMSLIILNLFLLKKRSIAVILVLIVSSLPLLGMQGAGETLKDSGVYLTINPPKKKCHTQYRPAMPLSWAATSHNVDEGLRNLSLV